MHDILPDHTLQENKISAEAKLWFGGAVSTLRESATRIALRLSEAGHEAYFAGGCVRDALMGRKPKDYDIATSARPEEVLALFPKADEIGAHFGVILVKADGTHFEIATFRSDGAYEDGRHPESVTFTTPEIDAQRRDFTINGLFENPVTGEIIDYVNGRADLEAGIIRAIGNPVERFDEDALRLMRAVRFATSTGFNIDPATWESIQSQAHLLKQISTERIREEFSRTLTNPQRRRGLELLVDSGLMEQFLPEFLPTRGCEQPPQFHPEGDVYVHTCIMLELLPPDASLELCLGVLFHDIGKPPTATYDEEADRIRFNGHDRVGAEMAEEILRRLRYSNATIEAVVALVYHHMQFMHVQQMRIAKLKRFMARPTFLDEIELHRVDCTSSHGMLDNIEFLDAKTAEFAAEPLIPSPLITGRHLISLGFSPGPKFSEILEYIQTEQLEGRLTSKDEALAAVHEKFSSD
jgi:putative nucleotidyltransferase with HDIG domain